MTKRELAARVGLLAVGWLAATADSAPTSLRATAVLLSLAGTAHLVSRLMRRDPIERLLGALGFLVIAGVLGGLALNVLPAGLSATTWATYFLLVGAVVLAVGHRRQRAPGSRPAGRGRLGAPSAALYLTAAVVLGSAIVVAVAGDRGDDIAPVAISVTDRRPSQVTVEVASGTRTEGLTLVVLGAQGAAAWQSPAFVLQPDQPHYATVPMLPGRWRINLVPAGASPTEAPVRELVVDF